MKKVFAIVMFLSAFLAACGQMGLEGEVRVPTAGATATPVGPTEAAPSATPAASAVPTQAATLAPTQAGDLLPAPLYFISSRNNQIWRIEPDGVTATQITREPFDIDEFDISPVDGSLVYVSNNTLIVTDANGEAREARINGPKIEPTDNKAQWKQQIRNPRWRPDGQEVFFGWGGLNMIVARGEDGPNNFLPAAPYPDEAAGRPTDSPANYWPYSISPDGSFLLAMKQYYPEGFSHVLVRLNSEAAPVELSNPAGPSCCDGAWSADSRTIYLGGDAPSAHGLDFVGLWKASVDDGVYQPLVRGYTGEPRQPPAPDATFTSVKFPFEAAGQLFAFADVRPATDEGQMQPDSLGLARVGRDGAVTIISPERFQSYEAIGAIDGSGAVLADSADWNRSGPYPLGRFRWLPNDGGPAVDLVEVGRNLRWGK